MVSTWAFLKGLSENQRNERFYLGIDLDRPNKKTINHAKDLSKLHGISFNFWQTNDMLIELPYTDMLFIDSLHTYCHLTYELEKFCNSTGKYIVMHDTSAPWEEQDEPYYGDYFEYPLNIDRNKKGLWQAVVDFLDHHPEWTLKERRLNNHGLTILKRV